MSLAPPILLATADESLPQVRQHLELHGYRVISATSPAETLQVVQQQSQLRGVIILSDWLILDEGAEYLKELLLGKTPTLTLVSMRTRRASGTRYMEEVFFPPAHEYIFLPFSLEELLNRMQMTGMDK